MFILQCDHVALALWNRRTSIYLTRLSTSATCGSICRGATMLTLPMRSPCCLKSWSIFISILRVLKRFCLFASCANAALRQTRDYGSLLWFFKLIAYRGSHVSMAAVSNPNFRKVRFSCWLGNKLRKVPPVLKRIFRCCSSCFYWRGARDLFLEDKSAGICTFADTGIGGEWFCAIAAWDTSSCAIWNHW